MSRDKLQHLVDALLILGMLAVAIVLVDAWLR